MNHGVGTTSMYWILFKIFIEDGLDTFSLFLLSLASTKKAVGCVSCEISAAMLFSNLHRNAD